MLVTDQNWIGKTIEKERTDVRHPASDTYSGAYTSTRLELTFS